jgi:hypothetical protein
MEADDPVGLKQDFGPERALSGSEAPRVRAVGGGVAFEVRSVACRPSRCAEERMRYLRQHGA